MEQSPCTSEMTEAEIKGAYELETGKVTLKLKDKDPNAIPSCFL